MPRSTSVLITVASLTCLNFLNIICTIHSWWLLVLRFGFAGGAGGWLVVVVVVGWLAGCWLPSDVCTVCTQTKVVPLNYVNFMFH